MNQNQQIEEEELRKQLDQILARRKVEEQWPWLSAEFKRFKRDKLGLDECIPRKFPVSHKAFLKLVLPERLYGRTAEQARLYRDWLAYELENEWLRLALAGRLSRLWTREEIVEEVTRRYAAERVGEMEERTFLEKAFKFRLWKRQKISRTRRWAALIRHRKK